MAVTSSEVGSVARYAHGRYGNTPQPFSVAAEAGRLKHQPGGLFWKGRMSDDEKLIVEACMNCKNYILGLCLHLDHWVEDDDWCAAWERLEQNGGTATCPPLPGGGLNGLDRTQF